MVRNRQGGIRMSRWIAATLASFCLALAACVTINVYFPAAAAEKAADRIIEDIWGPGQAQKPAADGQTSTATPPRGLMRAALEGALALVVPAAHAQADIDISSPAIRALTASMKARAASLDKFFASGAIGLTSDGLVEIRDPNAVPLADRTPLRKLVGDDNADRNSLYREIASANGHPEWEADIRSTFAERWIANARAGWYYKSKAGAWTQK
jgi:uncharacterized protein YdbL (DUF1318 family)